MLRNNRMKGFLQRKAMIRMLAGVCSLAVLMNTLLPVTAASEGATSEATMAKEENIAIADNLTYAEYHSGSSIEVVEEIDFSKYQVVEIVTEEDLKELAERCRLDSWSTDKYVTLKQDIVLEQYGDVSIPSFGGVFEGNGHKISGLYIQQEGSEWGLFRVLRKGGMIQNLSVAGIVSPQGSQEQVGGIVGSNYGTILKCTFTGKVKGSSEVGGIAGLGCDIFHSYAMPDIVITGECGGSIAGNVKKEGILNSNFYVENAYGGVDGRSYENGAQPLSYAELQELQNLPKEFTLLTVTFVAEGKELDSLTCRYGESIGEEQLPDIPGKEGYYGYWETEELEYVTGNRRVEAVYEKWITSLSSQETDALGRAILAVEGEFLPETTLALMEKDEETTFAIETMGEEYTKEVRVHYLWEESQKEPLVEVMTQAGWQQVDTKRVGSYLLFDMEGAGSFRLKEAPQTDYGKWIICGGAVVVGMILLTICIRYGKAKRRKGRVGNTGDMQQDVV